MKEINTRNVTLMENIESEGLEEIIEEKERRNSIIFVFIIFLFWIAIPTLISSLTLKDTQISTIAFNQISWLVIYEGIVVCASIVVFGILKSKVAPYKELYELAKENDETRHKAKIFYKEIKRLEKMDNEPTITTKQVIKSNQIYQQTKENKINDLNDKINKIKQLNLKGNKKDE